MKIALIGATGFVGSAVLKEALERGHEVSAVARHPEKIALTSDKLTLRKADVRHEDEVADAVRGHDVVISAYNAGWSNPNLYEEFLQGARAIQAGVKKAGVQRLLVVGGAGSLFDASGQQLVDQPDFPEAIKPGATAARDYLKELQQEEQLDWTFLSPAIEMHPGTSGERRGTYRTGFEQPVFNDEGRSVLSVEDLAVALIDEAEQHRFARKRFTVAY